MAIIPSELTALLVADPTSTGAVPTPTKVGANNISACLEMQSTTRALCLPRMTTTQRDAIAVPFNGMMLYNTTTNTINSYTGGVWGAGGGGDVDGPANSTANALSVFGDTTGKIIAATSILANPITSVISGVLGLLSGAGTAAAPTYSFSADADTGIYQSGANSIGIATGGVQQVGISGGATSVNYVNISGGVTGNGATVQVLGTDVNADLRLSGKSNGNVVAIGGMVLNSTQGIAPASNINQCYLSNAGAGGGLGSTLNITGSAVNGPVTTVNPTSPNRTIAISVNGTVYYLAAKTTND